MSVVPLFYNMTWERRKNVMSLIVEVPSNIKEIIAWYQITNQDGDQLPQRPFKSEKPAPDVLTHEMIA